jgi:hypothetical protein
MRHVSHGTLRLGGASGEAIVSAAVLSCPGAPSTGWVSAKRCAPRQEQDGSSRRHASGVRGTTPAWHQRGPVCGNGQRTRES